MVDDVGPHGNGVLTVGAGEFVYLDSVLMGYVVFGLVLIRVSAMVLTAQFFSALQFPLTVRVAVAIFFAFVCYPTASATFHWQAGRAINAADLVLLAGQEFLIGALIGFLTTVLFNAALMAGEIAGQQIGFSMASVMDPSTNMDTSLVGYLWTQLMMLLFVALNLHLYFVWLVDRSYEVVGIGALAFHPFLLAALEGTQLQTDSMFEVGLQMALPVILIMLMCNTIVGFVSRTMPQMNLMAVGMPLQIVLGLLAIGFMFPALSDLLVGGGMADIWFDGGGDGALRTMLETLAETIACMAPGFAK